ncbi:MAG: histidine kinase [Spirochaetaceae bacterium]|nr:histidine kinase [Spirochaetaceae bacterium]
MKAEALPHLGLNLRPFKSLSSRLLLFNILILFLPMGSLLFLDTFENQLLVSQENTMIQQGRILASALSGRFNMEDALEGSGEGSDFAKEALRILTNLRGRTDSRIRVINPAGLLVADSAVLVLEGTPADTQTNTQGYTQSDTQKDTREYTAIDTNNDTPGNTPEPETGERHSSNTNLLYRAVVAPVNILKKFFRPPSAGYSSADFYSGKQTLLGPEVQSALEGRYGAATRYSSGGQVSVTLYSAIPVFSAGEGILGAVLVSRSSYGILLNLYRLRLDIIKIFLVSLTVSLALSLVLSLTITRPIKRLKNEAEGVLDTRGRFSGHFTGLKRKDEIGDLSRSLKELSVKLEKRIGFIDRFISDLLHELKNPLSAIRGQTELALSSRDREEKLLRGIADEEGRMERLLARLRELSRIDNTIDREAAGPVDLKTLIPPLLEPYGGPAGPIRFEDGTERNNRALVLINRDRLVQALCNPLDNALSFSPPGKTVRIRLDREARAKRDPPVLWRITIDDDGPGIREESSGRYFERFYSERPEGEKREHSGLGLAIVKTIVETYGGSCLLLNRVRQGRIEGGRFVIRFPAYRGG